MLHHPRKYPLGIGLLELPHIHVGGYNSVLFLKQALIDALEKYRMRKCVGKLSAEIVYYQKIARKKLLELSFRIGRLFKGPLLKNIRQCKCRNIYHRLHPRQKSLSYTVG